MMPPTVNDMPPAARSAAGLSLQAAVQHAMGLHLDAKQAHWNVQGPSFIGLHKLFDKAADFGLSLRDGSAELARSMGTQIDARAVVEPLGTPLGLLSPGDTCEAYTRLLAHSMASLLGWLRGQAVMFVRADDVVTGDFYTKQASDLQHLLYLTESHLS